MESIIKIGTRKSPLAQWQARWVAKELEKQGVPSELVLIDTKGDRMLNVGIPEIGSKGVFTEDIELQLASGSIDIAVHSAKDMPSELPEEFELVAFTVRERATDVLVSHKKDFRWDKQMIIGTSSTRRVALLKHYHEGVRTTPVRGNLQTRIGKLQEGHMDALLLAYAGVHRMEMDHMIRMEMPLYQFVPAVGQGSLAIEVSQNLEIEKKQIVSQVLNDIPTAHCVLAERAFLKTLQGGCSIPAYAHATLDESIVNIQGGIISLDGQQKVEFTFQGDVQDNERLGNDLALKILEAGGHEILTDIKKQLNL